MAKEKSIGEMSTEFTKLLVELGDVYYVDKDKFVLSVHDDKPILIDINKNSLPMVIMHDDMVLKKTTALNIFTAPGAFSPERNWFYFTRSFIMGELIKQLLLAAVDVKADPDSDLKQLALVAKHTDSLDDKFKAEINKISSTDLLRIYYNIPKKTAQAQTTIFDDDFCDSLKMRKRSVKTMRAMISEFLKTNDVSEMYSHTVETLKLPEAEATLTVLCRLCKSLQRPVKLLLGIDLKSSALNKHLLNLEDYRKHCGWFNTNTLATPATKKKGSQFSAPAAKFGGDNVPSFSGSSRRRQIIAKTVTHDDISSAPPMPADDEPIVNRLPGRRPRRQITQEPRRGAWESELEELDAENERVVSDGQPPWYSSSQTRHPARHPAHQDYSDQPIGRYDEPIHRAPRDRTPVSYLHGTQSRTRY